MENIINKKTEKEIITLVEKYNKAHQQENPESDKLFTKTMKLLYEKLKNKRCVVTETYSIDDSDIAGIIDVFSINTSVDLNKIIHDELYGYYDTKDPLSIDFKIV